MTLPPTASDGTNQKAKSLLEGTTKGPWMLDNWLRGDDDYQHPHLIRQPNGDILARAPHLADARLIASVPDLAKKVEAWEEWARVTLRGTGNRMPQSLQDIYKILKFTLERVSLAEALLKAEEGK